MAVLRAIPSQPTSHMSFGSVLNYDVVSQFLFPQRSELEGFRMPARLLTARVYRRHNQALSGNSSHLLGMA